ncbi:MAG: hypothetical protein ACLRWQ_07010 [Flavonifractor plautii]
MAKILDLVENSSSKKAKAENFITKFARVLHPRGGAGRRGCWPWPASAVYVGG